MLLSTWSWWFFYCCLFTLVRLYILFIFQQNIDIHNDSISPNQSRRATRVRSKSSPSLFQMLFIHMWILETIKCEHSLCPGLVFIVFFCDETRGVDAIHWALRWLRFKWAFFSHLFRGGEGRSGSETCLIKFNNKGERIWFPFFTFNCVVK